MEKQLSVLSARINAFRYVLNEERSAWSSLVSNEFKNLRSELLTKLSVISSFSIQDLSPTQVSLLLPESSSELKHYLSTLNNQSSEYESLKTKFNQLSLSHSSSLSELNELKSKHSALVLKHVHVEKELENQRVLELKYKQKLKSLNDNALSLVSEFPKRRIQELEHETNEFKKICVSLEERLRESFNNIEKKDVEMSRLQSEFSRILGLNSKLLKETEANNLRFDVFQKRILDLDVVNQNSEQQIRNLNEKIQILQSNLDSEQKLRESFEQKFESKNLEFTEANNKCIELNTLIDQSNQELESLKKSLKDTQNSLNDQSNLTENFKVKFEASELELSQIKPTLSKLNQTNLLKSSENSALQNQLEQLKVKISDQNLVIDDLSSENNRLCSEINSLNEINSELKNENSKLIESFERKLDESKRDSLTFSDRVSALERDKFDLLTRNNELSRDLENYQKSLEFVELNQRINSLSSEKEELSLVLNQLSKNLIGFENEKSKYLSEISELSCEIENLKFLNTQLESNLIESEDCHQKSTSFQLILIEELKSEMAQLEAQNQSLLMSQSKDRVIIRDLQFRAETLENRISIIHSSPSISRLLSPVQSISVETFVDFLIGDIPLSQAFSSNIWSKFLNLFEKFELKISQSLTIEEAISYLINTISSLSNDLESVKNTVNFDMMTSSNIVMELNQCRNENSRLLEVINLSYNDVISTKKESKIFAQNLMCKFKQNLDHLNARLYEIVAENSKLSAENSSLEATISMLKHDSNHSNLLNFNENYSSGEFKILKRIIHEIDGFTVAFDNSDKIKKQNLAKLSRTVKKLSQENSDLQSKINDLQSKIDNSHSIHEHRATILKNLRENYRKLQIDFENIQKEQSWLLVENERLVRERCSIFASINRIIKKNYSNVHSIIVELKGLSSKLNVTRS
ncbi:hypothetical protein RCL1_005176 [Eukaryota sp. TZLM3-RCL]